MSKTGPAQDEPERRWAPRCPGSRTWRRGDQRVGGRALGLEEAVARLGSPAPEPKEASDVCGEPDKARGRWGCAGGARLERYFGGGEVGGRGPGANWRGVSRLWLQNVGLGSCRPRKAEQPVHANSSDLRDCDHSLPGKSGVAELWHPPRHLFHRERLTQVSKMLVKKLASPKVKLRFLGGIPQASRCL